MQRTLESIKDVIDKIAYKDWKIHLDVSGSVPWIQVQFLERNITTGQPEIQKGRKWMLSFHCCDNEIVRTAYKAIKTVIEHEIDENFKFHSIAIFNPHLNYSQLANSISFLVNEDIRK